MQQSRRAHLVLIKDSERPRPTGNRIPPIRKPYPWNVGRPQRLPHNLSQDQMKALLLAAAGHPRDRALLNLAYRYGLRPGEVGRLLVTDLDLESRTIRINRLKRGLAREFPLFEALVPILKSWLAIRCLPEDAPAPPPFEEDFLFLSRQLVRMNGSPAVVGITAKRVHQIVCAYGTLAAIPRHLIRGHCLRHTCATHLLDAGWNLEDVRIHLGHRSIASTLIYAQISSRRLRQRFAELEQSDAIVDP